LIAESLKDSRMAMALIERRVSAEAVQVSLACLIEHPHTRSPLDDNVERFIIPGSPALFERNQGR
jgi:hypothetical protein